jgi:hypothetical protein
MQITVHIPDSIAAAVQSRGLSLESYVQDLITSSTTQPQTRLVRLGPGPHSPEEAGRQIRAQRKGNRLDGLKIKELIEEGRRA